ncbi:MAG: hypothetical protein K2Y07_12035 [Nitrosomonas sp.]|nr:hypothetical protein [Nitrosomonas sp.]
MKTSQPINLDSSIRILKVATCPSLSGKSKLTYHIGCNEKSKILFRIANNTGGGFFSKEWIALDTILNIFDKQPDNKPIVSLLLYPLFQGKSLNTPAFLLAVLRQEGLVSQLEDHPKHYERMSSDEFMAEIEKLIQSKVDLKTDDAKPVIPTKKSASKN